MPTAPKKLESSDHAAPIRGTTKERGYSGSWVYVRRIKLAENPMCEFQFNPICTGYATEVHHKDRNTANNDSDNLASVCQSCHLKYHREHA